MSLSANSEAVSYAKVANGKTAAETGDRIEWGKIVTGFFAVSYACQRRQSLNRQTKAINGSGDYHCGNSIS
ncbi:mandelate racemase [Escherichia fergusonii]|nr:mandelate racemase [Escherichia fergusonii]